MIVLTNVSLKRGKSELLSNINFEIDQRPTALLGPNGAGKTTLIKCLTGIMRPTKGYVTASTEQKCGIGYLPQHFSFVSTLTVEEALTFLGILKGVKQSNLLEEINSVAQMTNLLDYLNVKVGALSGGTMRRMGVAQSLIGDSNLLLLDEPTAGLDIEERGNLISVLSRLQASRSVLVATHSVNDVEDLCERVLVMQRGRLIFDGSVEDVAELAEGRVIESSNRFQKKQRGIEAGTMNRRGRTYFRYLMPKKSTEHDATPSLLDGYLALIHDSDDDKRRNRA